MGPTDVRRPRPPLLHTATAVVTGIVALGFCLPNPATAQWTSASAGAGTVVSQSIPAGPTPTAVVVNRSVTVSWSAVTLSGGASVDGYRLERFDATSGAAASLTSCTGLIAATSCTETAVPPGTWRYRVSAARSGWSGTPGVLSAAVTVTPPTLTLTSSVVPASELPKALTGTLTQFAPSEGITYHLDSATGPVLSGSPSTVSSTGTAGFSVTIPTGTNTSPHSVFVVGATGDQASAPFTVVNPLDLTALEMFDTNTNGRIDRVVATFIRPLAPYSAGTAPWTLANVPSGGTLASVAVSGSTATLTLTEGTGPPSTAVGSFTVALAADQTGIRDGNGQTASFAATAPTDKAAPALMVLPSMNDTTANGKVDQVTMTFTETLATYSAGTAPWTLANVPSGGTLSAASASGNTATLTVAEGAGAVDTTVGGFTLSLASSVVGIRDAAGNLTTLSTVTPQDKAKPILLTSNAFDDNVDGRFDRVQTNWSEPLAAYTAGLSGWTMSAAPSGTSIASVTVPTGGTTVTLALNQSTAATTSVGSWTIALATTAGGVRDAAGNLASVAATAPADKAAPAVVSATIQDLTSGDGIVDRVSVVFSETLATYTAGTTPWTLANVPSGSTVSAAAASGTTVTLTLGSPAGAANTAVGSMTVAMAANAAGVRDTAGNVTAFGPLTPLDGAGQVPVTVATGVSGSSAGLAQAGDTIVLTLSEALGGSVSLPATTTVTLSDRPGNANDLITIPGLFSGDRDTGSAGYVTSNNSSAAFTGSTLSLSADRKTITVTLAATCTGSGCSSLGVGAVGSLSVLLDPSLVDGSGNVPTTVVRTFSVRLF